MAKAKELGKSGVAVGRGPVFCSGRKALAKALRAGLACAACLCSAGAGAQQYYFSDDVVPWPAAAYGRGFFEDTGLLHIRQGGLLTNMARRLGDATIESSAGEKIPLWKMYEAKWTDFRVLWMTQAGPNTGIIWGASTGEKALRYEIEPSLVIGGFHRIELGKGASLSLSGTAVVGGWLKEKPCVGDYGEIGGVQKVNCRLAASELAPSETLKYLAKEPPKEDVQFMVRFHYVW